MGAGAARRPAADAARAPRRRARRGRLGGGARHRRRRVPAHPRRVTVADANAVLSGGSLTNEKAYLMGKFARLALGTRHIDYNGRFCMVSAGSANMKAFGMDRAMTPLDELDRRRRDRRGRGEPVRRLSGDAADDDQQGPPARRPGGRHRPPLRSLGAGRRPADRHPSGHRRCAVPRSARRDRARRVCSTSTSSTHRTVGFYDAIGAARPWRPERRRGGHRRRRRRRCASWPG